MTLHENKPLFSDAIYAASKFLNIRPIYIEKDYWITRSLSLLSKSPLSKHAVFKGGTSLSKAYMICDRFSEDIDIAITDVNGLTGNQIKMLARKLCKDMTTGMKEEIVEGITSKKTKYRKVVYVYPSVFARLDGDTIASGRLLVEINSFGNACPHVKKELTCFLADFLKQSGNDDLLEKYGLQSFTLNVLDKRRTMMEKLMSLIRFSLSDNYTYDVGAKIRHFYDLHFLVNDSECNAYLASTEFTEDLTALFNHDQKEFDIPVGWKGKSLKQSPLLSDFQSMWKNLGVKYKKELSGLAFSQIPDEKDIAESFDKIVGRLRKIM